MGASTWRPVHPVRWQASIQQATFVFIARLLGATVSGQSLTEHNKSCRHSFVTTINAVQSIRIVPSLFVGTVCLHIMCSCKWLVNPVK